MTVSRKQAMKAAVDAAMTVAEDVVGGRVQPAALESAVVSECRALFGAVSGLEDPLAPLQLDVCRQVLAAGWIPASELAEWLAVAHRQEGESVSPSPPAICRAGQRTSDG